MKSKIIFLDIDGVLNSTEWIHERLKKVHKTLIGTDILDIKARDRLRLFLIEHPNVKLVISSSWRYSTLKRTKEEFMKCRMCTLVPFIVGVTKRSFRTRGEQIAEYVNRYHVRDYVIIDDEDYDIHQKDRLVKTDYKYGIQDVHYKEIKRILRL